jgi:stage 0 sporulation regulatory protein
MRMNLVQSVLIVKIKLKKRAMYRKAKRFGLTDSRVITCSQQLDILLNKFQEITYSNRSIPWEKGNMFGQSDLFLEYLESQGIRGNILFF